VPLRAGTARVRTVHSQPLSIALLQVRSSAYGGRLVALPHMISPRECGVAMAVSPLAQHSSSGNPAAQHRSAGLSLPAANRCFLLVRRT